MNKQIVEKILKLMELADPEKNANAHEVEAAQRKVVQLMQKYGVTYDDVERSTITVQRYEPHSPNGEGNHYYQFPGWFKWVWGEVAKFMGVYLVYGTGNKRHQRPAYFFLTGTERAREQTIYMATALANQIWAQSEVWKKRHPHVRRRDYNAYRMGLVDGLSERLTQMLQDATQHKAPQAEGQTEALVPLRSKIARRRELGRQVYEQEHGKTQKTSTSHSSQRGYRSGQSDSDNISLRRGMGNGNGQRSKALRGR